MRAACKAGTMATMPDKKVINTSFTVAQPRHVARTIDAARALYSLVAFCVMCVSTITTPIFVSVTIPDIPEASGNGTEVYDLIT